MEYQKDQLNSVTHNKSEVFNVLHFGFKPDSLLAFTMGTHARDISMHDLSYDDLLKIKATVDRMLLDAAQELEKLAEMAQPATPTG